MGHACLTAPEGTKGRRIEGAFQEVTGPEYVQPYGLLERFHSKRNGKPLEDFEHMNDVI